MRPLIAVGCFCIVLFVSVSAIPTSSKESREDLMRNFIHFLQRQQQGMTEDKWAKFFCCFLACISNRAK